MHLARRVPPHRSVLTDLVFVTMTLLVARVRRKRRQPGMMCAGRLEAATLWLGYGRFAPRSLRQVRLWNPGSTGAAVEFRTGV
jgi:hypothetical protein